MKRHTKHPGSLLTVKQQRDLAKRKAKAAGSTAPRTNISPSIIDQFSAWLTPSWAERMHEAAQTEQARWWLWRRNYRDEFPIYADYVQARTVEEVRWERICGPR